MNRASKNLIACGLVAILVISFASSTHAFGGRHRQHGRSGPGAAAIYPSQYVSPRDGDTPPRAKRFGYGIGYGKPSIAVRF
jgi:hypothetical protein